MMLSAWLILLFMVHVVYLRCAVLTSRPLPGQVDARAEKRGSTRSTKTPLPHPLARDHVLTGGPGTTLSWSVARNLEQRLKLDIADG
jgi:hypothetical protein